LTRRVEQNNKILEVQINKNIQRLKERKKLKDILDKRLWVTVAHTLALNLEPGTEITGSI
jgi:hypothetical protein